MDNKKAIVKSGAISAVSLSKEFKISVGELQTIQNTIAKGATVEELKLFLFQAKRTGLDPFSRQIHLVKRNTKDGEVAVIQTGIDGYRAIAERTGKYAGSDDPVYDIDEPGKKPGKATVKVWKIVNGERVAFEATARWAEYYPGDKMGFMWNGKPYLMLGKCAEALALRKAFPADLSGLYVQEELQKDETVIPPEKPPFREVVMTAIKFAESCNENLIPNLQQKMIDHKFTSEETRAVEDILCDRGFCKGKDIVQEPPKDGEFTEEDKKKIIEEENKEVK